MRKILVCGGRDYDDYAKVCQVLDVLHFHRTIDLIVHGAAPGADSLAEMWGKDNGVATDPNPARWRDLSHKDAVIRKNKFGKYDARAGHRRNREMLRKHPDIELVVAFPGHTGTADMTALARKANIEVREVLDAFAISS